MFTLNAIAHVFAIMYIHVQHGKCNVNVIFKVKNIIGNKYYFVTATVWEWPHG